MRKLCIPAFFCLLLVSCTVTKRHYRSGFHVHRHHVVNTISQTTSTDKKPAEAFSPSKPVILNSTADSAGSFPQTSEVTDKSLRSPVIKTPVKKEEKRPGPLLQQIRASPKHKKAFRNFDGETERNEKRQANSSLVLGIVSILFWPFVIIPIYFALAAIQQGRLALHNKTGKNPSAVKKAKAGIVLGCILLYYYWIVLIVLAFALFVALLGVTGDIAGVFGAMAIAGIWLMLFIVLLFLFLMTRLMIRRVF